MTDWAGSKWGNQLPVEKLPDSVSLGLSSDSFALLVQRSCCCFLQSGRAQLYLQHVQNGEFHQSTVKLLEVQAVGHIWTLLWAKLLNKKSKANNNPILPNPLKPNYCLITFTPSMAWFYSQKPNNSNKGCSDVEKLPASEPILLQVC